MQQWKQTTWLSNSHPKANEKGQKRKLQASPTGPLGPLSGEKTLREKPPARKRKTPASTGSPARQEASERSCLPTSHGLSARRLKQIGAQNAPGGDKSRDETHLMRVRQLSDLRRDPGAAGLGKSRNTPDDLETSYKSTPTLFQDPLAFARSVELYRDQPITPEALDRWQAVGARAFRHEPEDKTAARAYQLRDLGRQVHPLTRCAECGFRPVGEVALMRRPDGKHAIGGVLTCGSVWSCPVCAMRIKGKRAEQIKEGVERHRLHHGPASMALLSLTIRHNKELSLRRIIDGFQAAHDDFWRLVPKAQKERNRWRKFCGLDAESWKSEAGFIGYVSGSETTWGKHGWHFHRHYALAFRANVGKEEIGDMVAKLRDHWRACVVRHLGKECEPSDEHGLDLRPLHLADYISKLGLEVSDVGTKSARGGNVSPWGLLSGAARGSGQGLDALAEYVHATKGAKCVQFSNALKEHWEKLGASGRDDNDAELADETKGAELVYELSKGDWMRLRCSGRVRAFIESADSGRLPVPSNPPPGWGDQSRVEDEALGGGRSLPMSPEERRAWLKRSLEMCFSLHVA